MLQATITPAAESFSRFTAFPQKMSALHPRDKHRPIAIVTTLCAIMHHLNTIDNKFLSGEFHYTPTQLTN